MVSIGLVVEYYQVFNTNTLVCINGDRKLRRVNE